jgi:RNA polymerase sigma-70 factor (ECF subfamily)
MSLVRAFRAALPELPPGAAEDPALEAILARASDDARTARKDGYALPAERFAAHLGRVLASTVPSSAARLDVAAALATRNLGDLLLAAGCAAGDPAAIRAFDLEFGGEIERAFRRSGPRTAQLDDVKQLLATKLFVAEPGGPPPKIAEYSGSGPLRVWLRVVLVRLLQNLGTRGPRELLLDGETLADAAGATLDPELERLRELYKDAFRRAFAAAAASVPLRERVLLHQSFALRRTQDSLAAEYQVHVNTVARWLARARERLEQAVRLELSQRLRLGDGDFTSIVRLVGAHLDVTLGRLAPLPSEDEAPRDDPEPG